VRTTPTLKHVRIFREGWRGSRSKSPVLRPNNSGALRALRGEKIPVKNQKFLTHYLFQIYIGFRRGGSFYCVNTATEIITGILANIAGITVKTPGIAVKTPGITVKIAGFHVF